MKECSKGCQCNTVKYPVAGRQCSYACTALPHVCNMTQWLVYYIVCCPDGGERTVWWLGHGIEVWKIWFNSRERWKLSLFSKLLGMVPGHSQTPIQWVALSPAVKRLERWSLHLTLSSSEVVNDLSCTAKLLWHHGLNRDNFRVIAFWQIEYFQRHSHVCSGTHLQHSKCTPVCQPFPFKPINYYIYRQV